MAARRTQILIISIALTFALIVALVFPTVIFPLLPPLRPLTAQLLVRLRDIFAFLAFTTALAVGIFSTQRKDAQSNKKKEPFLEHHPLGSIFGEPGHGETEHLDVADEDAQEVPKTMVTSYGSDAEDFSIDRASSAMVNGSLLQKRSARLAMEAARERNLPISKEEYGASTTEPKVQKKLHRKSSSLDDSVNYEPEVEVARPITPNSSPPPSTLGKTKSVKRVSFSLTTPPTSSLPDETTKKSGEETAEKKSPGDLTRQADAYIAKVKEQLRMQRLESLQRYRRRVS